jgi:hypothetical protein
MLEYFLLKKLQNGNVFTINVLPSRMPTPLYANLLIISDLFTSLFNTLTPKLKPSAQRWLTRFLLGILLLEPAFR